MAKFRLTSFRVHGRSSYGAVIDAGMQSGKPSVALRVDILGEKTALIETSARQYCAAARAIMVRYPDLFDSDA